MGQGSPCMPTVGTAKNCSACASVENLRLCGRNAKRAVGGMGVHESKGLAAILRDIDACITRGINGAMRPGGGEIENPTVDAFDNLPVQTAIATACHTIATVSEQLPGDTRDGEYSRDAPEWECPGRGKMLSIIQADFQAQRSKIGQVDIYLVGSIIPRRYHRNAPRCNTRCR